MAKLIKKHIDGTSAKPATHLEIQKKAKNNKLVKLLFIVSIILNIVLITIRFI